MELKKEKFGPKFWTLLVVAIVAVVALLVVYTQYRDLNHKVADFTQQMEYAETEDQARDAVFTLIEGTHQENDLQAIEASAGWSVFKGCGWLRQCNKDRPGGRDSRKRQTIEHNLNEYDAGR